MRVIASCAASVAAVFLIASPVSAQEKSAKRQDFELVANSQKRIIVYRPSINVGAQSTGGMFEPNAEWTERSTLNIFTALEKYQSKLGNVIFNAPESYGDEAVKLNEYMALFTAVSQSVISYQFFMGNRLPTKKEEMKNGVFNWTLGPGVADLPGAKDADYALFIYNRDAYGSTGRKMLQLFGAVAGVGITSGEHLGYAGLVDLRTGNLLWLNADGQMGGDVREPDGADKRVRQLLAGFPGAETLEPPVQAVK